MTISQQFVGSFATALTEQIESNALASVASAVSGIPIIGGVASAVLTAWADDLAAQANAAAEGVATLSTGITTGAGVTPSSDPADAQAAVAQLQSQAADAAAAAAANEANLVAANASTVLTMATLAPLTAVPHNVPVWFSLNPLEDVSFPRTEIVDAIATVSSVDGVGGTIGNGLTIQTAAATSTSVTTSTGGTYCNQHAISFQSGVSYVPASGTLQLAYINATRDRIYNTIGLVALCTGTAAPMYVGIYKMNLTSGVPNGDLTLVYASSDISGSITSSMTDIRVNLSSDVNASQGDWYAVAILQVTASGKTLSSVACKMGIAITAPAGYNPSKPVMTLTSQTSLQSTLTGTGLDKSSVTIPWACLGQQSAVVKADIIDLFDRADSGTLGPNWAVYISAIGISSNAAAIGALGNPGYAAYATYQGLAINTSQATTDSQASIATLGTPAPVTAHYGGQPTAVMVRANNTATAYVAAAFDGTNVTILTPSTQLATTTCTQVYGDVVEIHCAGNVYTAYINGTPVLTYTDSSNVLPVGVSNRFIGFYMWTWAFGGDLLDSPEGHTTAPVIQWEGKDL